MGQGQKKAYENLSAVWCIPFSKNAVSFPDIFPGRERVVVEIGFGMGHATAEIAALNRETAFLGIEVHKPGVGKLLSLIEEKKLENIRILEHDAVEVLETMIPDASLHGMHIFFPDPWPKKKHHKRRLIQDSSVGLFVRKLAPGGYIYASTDWEDYAEQILSVFSRAEFLENTSSGYSQRPHWRPETAFERKGLEKGHRIREILFRKPVERA